MAAGTVTLVSRSADGAPAGGRLLGRADHTRTGASPCSAPRPRSRARRTPTAARTSTRASSRPGAIALVSQAADGTAGDGPSIAPSVSADARFVAFLSRAPKLTGQPAGPYRVVRRDLAQPAGFAVAGIGLDLPPRSLIGAPNGKVALERRRLRFIEGTAADDFLVTRVQIAVSKRAGGRCNFLKRNGRSFAKRPLLAPAVGERAAAEQPAVLAAHRDCSRAAGTRSARARSTTAGRSSGGCARKRNSLSFVLR